MDLLTIIGFVSIALAIFFGAPDLRMEPLAYLDLDSFILVFFGSLSCLLLSSNLKELKGDIKNIFKKEKEAKITVEQTINLISDLAKNTQGNLLTALTNFNKTENLSFTKDAEKMISAGLDKDFIQETLQNKIEEKTKKDYTIQQKIKLLGTYSTMFGMAGTVMGVIQVLKEVTDINNVIVGLSLALLTTLYGIFLSNILYIPWSKRIEAKIKKETLNKNIIKEGIYLLMNKELPIKIRYYLSSYATKK